MSPGQIRTSKGQIPTQKHIPASKYLTIYSFKNKEFSDRHVEISFYITGIAINMRDKSPYSLRVCNLVEFITLDVFEFVDMLIT